MFSSLQHLFDRIRLPTRGPKRVATAAQMACDPSQSSKLSEFFQTLDAQEAAYVERLFAAIEAMEADQAAHAQLDELLSRLSFCELDEMLVRVLSSFGLALKRRSQPQRAGGGNLYLGARPPGKQLRAFELLRLRTPLISFAYAAANRALLDVISKPCDLTLLDVGIGIGGQLRALLQNPATKHLVRSLHVIGVDPDPLDALALAQRTVREAGWEAGIETTFLGIAKTAEQLTAQDIRAARPGGLFLANSAFCLHHLPCDATRTNRDSLLALLRQVGVRSLVLVEPDSNHTVEDPATRFLYAYRHYRTVSRVLHSCLSEADAALVWNDFYHPEVQNVIAHDGSKRTERHETSEVWTSRLQKAGWRVDKLRDVVARAAAPSGFEVESYGHACSLSYQRVPLLSVLRARQE